MEEAVGHPDGLAVVGFLLEAVDAPNPRFDKFVEGLEKIQKRDVGVQVPAGKEWYTCDYNKYAATATKIQQETLRQRGINHFD